jgi:hypothetical protein
VIREDTPNFVFSLFLLFSWCKKKVLLSSEGSMRAYGLCYDIRYVTHTYRVIPLDFFG